MEVSISITAGLTDPTFVQQARKQKLNYDKGELQHYQKQRDAIYMCNLNSLISDKIAVAAMKTLTGRVVSCIAKSNKLKRIKK